MQHRSTQPPPPAPIPQRAGAFLIDTFILVVGLVVISQVLQDLQYPDRAIAASLLVLYAAYHIGFLASTSSTPGKMAAGIWVCDQAGRRIRPDQAILRQLVFTAITFLGIVDIWASIALLGVLLLSVVMVLLDSSGRRALHDRVAGTLVVRGRPPEPEDAY